jgi:hypothetical protein
LQGSNTLSIGAGFSPSFYSSVIVGFGTTLSLGGISHSFHSGLKVDGTLSILSGILVGLSTINVNGFLNCLGSSISIQQSIISSGKNNYNKRYFSFKHRNNYYFIIYKFYFHIRSFRKWIIINRIWITIFSSICYYQIWFNIICWWCNTNF